MINRTVLVGRLTKDPELRYTQDNKAVANFTLAANDRYNKDRTDFIKCIVWNKQAENVEKFIHKGSLVGVEGRIQTGYYDKEDGTRVYTTDVVCDSVQFLEPKGTQPQDTYQDKKNDTPRLDDIQESDLPF